MSALPKKAVILAGGRGRRLRPFTTTIPKPLFPVGEKPIIQIILEQLVKHGIHEILISVGYLGELIEAYLGNGSKYHCNIEYLREDKPLGTAGAISLIPEITEDFFLMNGDILTSLDFNAAYRAHVSESPVMTICTYKKFVKSSLGVLEVSEANDVTNYLEKPETSLTVSSGIYVVSPRIKEYVHQNEHLDIPELVTRLIGHHERVKTFEIVGDWFDIGTPEDLENAVKYFESK